DLVEMLRIIGEHSKLYRSMLGETGSAGFLHRMREAIRSAVAASLHRLPGVDQWPIDHRYYFDYIAGAAVSVVLGWLEREPETHPDEIARQLWWLIAHRPDAARIRD
ncbi:MAG: hypothetical protein GXX90_11885, partial [Microbacteriaceae bacterium]|nr:hypothetical protein [Microbacteriaceae bacterium]